MKIDFFNTGQTMAFENGVQVPEAQKCWFLCYVEYLDSKGIDPVKQTFHMFDKEFKVFKIDGEFNYEVI